MYTMLKLSVNLYNIPIFSLRTGQIVGCALRPLVNPNNLKIEAWFVESKFEDGQLLLPSIEIREISRQGIAVNDHDAMTHVEELVRLEPLAKFDFQLQGKPVVTESKKRLGKVDDYATDLESFYIQKLYVTQKGIRAFTHNQLSVSRNQIVEITAKKIIIKDVEETVPIYFKTGVAAAES